MIKAKNLTKLFGHIPAVDDISFSAEKGEVLGFLGPNGAGKTTTMKMLTGMGNTVTAHAGPPLRNGCRLQRNSAAVDLPGRRGSRRGR